MQGSRRAMLAAVGSILGAAFVRDRGDRLGTIGVARARALQGRVPFVTFAPLEYMPSLLREYEAIEPGISLVPADSRQANVVRTAFTIDEALPEFIASGYVQMAPLNGALALEQVNTRNVLAGGMAAFTIHGQVLGVPLSVVPCAVGWRRDVFAAAGLPPPSPYWSWAEFVNACNVIQGLAQAGRLGEVKWALGPMTGTFSTQAAGRTIATWGGAATTPGIWEAFALGFGGVVASGDKFDLTSSGVVRGLREFVNVTRRFAMPARLVPTKDVAAVDSMPDWYAMAFSVFAPQIGPAQRVAGVPQFDSRWEYARLPVFPVRPVVTVGFLGAGLQYSPPPGSHTTLAQALETNARAIGIGSRFLSWLVGPRAQAMIAASGLPPVLSNGQDGFWTRQKNGKAVGDWRRFVYFAENWPVLPPPAIMNSVLGSAVADPGSLEAGLREAQLKMNNYVAMKQIGR